jgi:selenide,water dikinase
MAKGSDLCLHIVSASLPVLSEAVELCGEGFTCGGTKSNAAFLGTDVGFAPDLAPAMIGLLNDPQTSGGLLVSVPSDRVAEMQAAILANDGLCAAVVGEAKPRLADGPYLAFE